MAKTPRSLTGKVAVITGGARGIGQAIARALARGGRGRGDRRPRRGGAPRPPRPSSAAPPLGPRAST